MFFLNLYMRKLFEFVYNSISENLGHPITLLRLIDEYPDMRVELIEPVRVIDSQSIAQWHHWGNQPSNEGTYRKLGAILGWRYSAGRYNSFEIYRSEFENLGHCDVMENWNCDIQDVTGLTFSKSKLHKFTSLDSMVEANSRELIDSIAEDKLLKNLAHDEIRILSRENTSDYFARYLWDDRIFLVNNSGGSHHFAAARYIASRIAYPISLQGTLRTYFINSLAIDSLRCDFDMYSISDDAAISTGFHEAMEKFRATYLWQYLPRPYEHARAILLPKSDPRSMRVSTVLRDAGFFDIGKYLADLAGRVGTRAHPNLRF